MTIIREAHLDDTLSFLPFNFKSPSFIMLIITVILIVWFILLLSEPYQPLNKRRKARRKKGVLLLFLSGTLLSSLFLGLHEKTENRQGVFLAHIEDFHVVHSSQYELVDHVEGMHYWIQKLEDK